MADDAAIVNVLNILGKNFTALSDNVSESSKRQESLTQQLTDSLKSIVNVQSAQLKLAEDAEKAAKKRQSGLEQKKAEDAKAQEAKQKADAITKGQESIPIIGKFLKDDRERGETGKSIAAGLAPVMANLQAKSQQYAAKAATQTGLRAKATGGMGRALGGLGGLVGKIAKFMPIIMRALGPIGIAANILLKAFKLLQGAIGFLISGAIAFLGVRLFAMIEMFKDLTGVVKQWWADTKEGFNILVGELKTAFNNTKQAVIDFWNNPPQPDDWWYIISTSASDFAGKIAESSNYIGELFPGLKKYTDEIANLSTEVSNYWGDPPTPSVWWEDTKEGFKIVTDGIKESLVEMFGGVIDFIKEKITAVLDFAGGVADTVKETAGSIWDGVTGFFGGEEEQPLPVEIKELTPYDFQGGTIYNNLPPVKIEGVVSDEMLERHNKSLEENNQQSQKLNQSFELLINTIDKKDLGTTVINNTEPAPTQSYSNGGKVRK